MQTLKNFAINAALVCGSVVACLLVGEFFVFRFVIPASDVPINAYADGLIRYAPHQYGIWRVRNEVAAPYAINAQGWNSGVGDYSARKNGVRRVAVVGDSFVEALQVPYDRSFAEIMAGLLSRGGAAAEAYRFAISGAPLSQYVRMAEREAVRYEPDDIVVLVVHNDFVESFRFVPGRYTSSFLKLSLEGGRVAGEIEPTPWQPGFADVVRTTATARFLYYRWQVKPETVKRLFVSPAAAQGGVFGANIDAAAALALMPDVAAAADYLFGRLAAIARRRGARLLIAMDGDRHAIYAGEAGAPALTLNAMAAQAAKRHDIRFVDLHPVFSADWQANRRRFEFETDGHWNAHGHAVAAGAIVQAMLERPMR